MQMLHHIVFIHIFALNLSIVLYNDFCEDSKAKLQHLFSSGGQIGFTLWGQTEVNWLISASVLNTQRAQSYLLQNRH